MHGPCIVDGRDEICIQNRTRRNHLGDFLYRRPVTNMVTWRNFEFISNKFQVNRICTRTYSCMERCTPHHITTVCNVFTPNKLAQAVTLPTLFGRCQNRISAEAPTILTEVFLWFSSIPPGRCRDNTLH
jgi:hypothetical protein